MAEVTHIRDWKTAGGSPSDEKTLCGFPCGRYLGIRQSNVKLAENPHAATCLTCRKIRDGRGSGW